MIRQQFLARLDRDSAAMRMWAAEFRAAYPVNVGRRFKPRPRTWFLLGGVDGQLEVEDGVMVGETANTGSEE